MFCIVAAAGHRKLQHMLTYIISNGHQLLSNFLLCILALKPFATQRQPKMTKQNVETKRNIIINERARRRRRTSDRMMYTAIVCMMCDVSVYGKKVSDDEDGRSYVHTAVHLDRV